MYHVLKMSGKFYASNVSRLDEEELVERVVAFASEGTPSILVEELEDLEELDIYDDVTIVPIED